MSTYVGQHSKLIFSLPLVNWVFGHVFCRGFPLWFLRNYRKLKKFRGILKTSAEEREAQLYSNVAKEQQSHFQKP